LICGQYIICRIGILRSKKTELPQDKTHTLCTAHLCTWRMRSHSCLLVAFKWFIIKKFLGTWKSKCLNMTSKIVYDHLCMTILTCLKYNIMHICLRLFWTLEFITLCISVCGYFGLWSLYNVINSKVQNNRKQICIML
jgi:hypothetical protein